MDTVMRSVVMATLTTPTHKHVCKQQLLCSKQTLFTIGSPNQIFANFSTHVVNK